MLLQAVILPLANTGKLSGLASGAELTPHLAHLRGGGGFGHGEQQAGGYGWGGDRGFGQSYQGDA